MLVELHIEDLALIERTMLPWGEGLNVVTGETGAGKSLLIDALELLLGQRARSGLVRRDAARAQVEGRFLVAAGGYGHRVRSWLSEHLPQVLEDEEDDQELELILTRSVGVDGRSRAQVNHRPVTQRVLRDLASQLIEIHGQNDHQRLFEPTEQVELLDSFAKVEEVKARYQRQHRAYRDLYQRYESLCSGNESASQRLELLRFQAQELQESSPSVAEQEALTAERERLRHGDQLARELGALLGKLRDTDGAALELLRSGEQTLDAWERKVAELGVPASQLRDAVAHTEEVCRSLSEFLEGIESDPVRLHEVEERLHVFGHLERKYRTDIEGLEGLSQRLESEIAELEKWEGGSERAEQELLQQAAALTKIGKELAKARHKESPRLEKSVHRGLAELGLEHAKFSVSFEETFSEAASSLPPSPSTFGTYGLERVELLLAANPGENLAPLRKVASGGEMARIMLALRGALAVQQSTPTLIFDEVDTGVGGRLGPQVGGHLRKLAKHHQVVCVTHLPALAAEAHHHLKVKKQVFEGRTHTQVTTLTTEERVEEIADMIAGGADQETAKAEARRLLESKLPKRKARAKKKSRATATKKSRSHSAS